MDGWIEILVFVAFVAFGVFMDKRQKKAGNADSDAPDMSPQPDMTEATEAEQPQPAMQQPWIPQPEPTVQQAYTRHAPKKPKRKQQKAAFTPDPVSRVTRQQPASPLPQKEAESEYAFKSIDDVRKAIVWAEIINRKY